MKELKASTDFSKPMLREDYHVKNWDLTEMQNNKCH